jgi:hypothetical protein
LSKTPSIGEMNIATIKAAAKQFMISPGAGFLKKKDKSRFKFAHSVDPLNYKNIEKNFSTIFDDDEI